MGSPPEEQLRRLKNTVMGAGHRLAQLAGSGALPEESIQELASISQELTRASQRLERLLGRFRQDR